MSNENIIQLKAAKCIQVLYKEWSIPDYRIVKVVPFFWLNFDIFTETYLEQDVHSSQK